jgi:hypothetical protein
VTIVCGEDIGEKADPQYERSVSGVDIDLFFIVQFVLKIPIANHPFVVRMCREVEDGPQDYTLDVWAREHFKSSIITIAETIQYVLGHPNDAVGIFSYVRPVAKKFLFSIKELFQHERSCTLLPGRCMGIARRLRCRARRGFDIEAGQKGPMRRSAWGLTEGMPTGRR